jgi:hypothetical protein
MSWRDEVSVYRQTGEDRHLDQNKEKIAEFRYSADADFFAYSASNSPSDWLKDVVYWTVEDRHSIIKRYEQKAEDAE